MSKTYKFSVTVNNAKSTFSPMKGIDIYELGELIQGMKLAIDPQDGSYCTMYKISNHGYTSSFVTDSKRTFENFISVHQNIYEKPYEDLRNKEVKYAKTLKSILHKGMYLESFAGTRAKPIAKILPSQINKPVDSYNVITNVIGIVSEMGSPDFRKRTHVFLDGLDYKIYTDNEQDLKLKDYYRNSIITLKVRQKRSIKSDRIISAVLLDIYPKTKGTLEENIKKLKKTDLSFLKNASTHEDILKLIGT